MELKNQFSLLLDNDDDPSLINEAYNDLVLERKGMKPVVNKVKKRSCIMKINENFLCFFDLPEEIMLLILTKVGPFNILMDLQKVCMELTLLTLDSQLFEKLDLRFNKKMDCKDFSFSGLVRQAVKRGGKQIKELIFDNVVERDHGFISRLKDFSFLVNLGLCCLDDISEEQLVGIFKGVPFLQSLHICLCYPITKETINQLAFSCPLINRFECYCSHQMESHFFFFNSLDRSSTTSLIEGLVNGLPNIRFLALRGLNFTRKDINMILAGFPLLLELDLGQKLVIGITGEDVLDLIAQYLTVKEYEGLTQKLSKEEALWYCHHS